MMQLSLWDVEVWRPIPGNPAYAVSNHGRVMRTTGHTNGATIGRVLKPGKNSRGYFFVNLHQNGERKFQYVHRLVALAFLGECPHGLVVNHIDNNQLNNTPSNLEYVTQARNMQHASETGRRKHGLSEEKSHQIRALYAAGGVTQTALGKQFGVSQRMIGYIVHGRSWAVLSQEAQS